MAKPEYEGRREKKHEGIAKSRKHSGGIMKRAEHEKMSAPHKSSHK